MRPDHQRTILQAALAEQRPFFRKTLFFSFFVSLLVLAPTMYMLEVYDKVVNSRSGTTLAMLTLLVIGAYVVMELLEWVRGRLLHQAAVQFDEEVNERLLGTLFEARLRRLPEATLQVFNDLRTFRDFLSSPALLAAIDVPLASLYTVAIFLIHPMLGWLSVLGAFLQVSLAWLTERHVQPPLARANAAAIRAQNYADASLRNAQVIEAMGMEGDIHRRWLDKQNEFLIQQAGASDQGASYASLAKFVQLAQSSLLLGLGCWLVIRGQLPDGGGLMIVASTLGGRLLAPVVQAIGSWKQIVNARDAYGRLERLFQTVALEEPGMPLPPPRGFLSVEHLVAGPPGSRNPILRGVNFHLPPGMVLAVVGAAAAGKSTLARLLVGIWPAMGGKVRLDGVDVFSWNKAELGPYIGYLPQDVELFDGTLAENIARFSEPDLAEVEAAARAVGVHDMILALPEGYGTRIGEDGCFLSGGQRQRIALARAIYGNPRLIVLDEPNSNLDEAGDNALVETLLALKARGATIIVITHRTSLLGATDMMLFLKEGQVKAFGTRDQVLAAMRQGRQGEGAAEAVPPQPAWRPATA